MGPERGPRGDPSDRYDPAVTVRGGATEAARVCPFVALDDDRDRRLDHPDHRHRCYAEAPPAPRAIAHQEAYCLSPSFPGCPVFQDWANREAANVARGGADRADRASTERRTSEREPAGAMPIAAAAAAAGASDRAAPPDRDGRPQPPAQRRDGIEPGPWDAWTDAEADGDVRERGEPRRDDAQSNASDPAAIPPRRRQPRDWAEPPPWGGADAGPADDPNAAPPPFLAERDALSSRDPRADDDARAAPGAPRAAALSGAGLAASPAARAARGPEPGPEDDDDADYEVARERTDRRRSIAAGRLRGAERDASVPPWEPRKRSEAYPALKTPMSLPRLGPLAGAVAALAIAALALFFIVPALLDLGGDGGGPGGGGGSSASPSAAVSPAASAVPATPAAPTPQVYVIKQGDTLSKIAKKFGLTVDDILQANTTTIKDPNKIALGEQIVIPVPSPSDDGSDASAEPASPSPSA